MNPVAPAAVGLTATTEPAPEVAQLPQAPLEVPTLEAKPPSQTPPSETGVSEAPPIKVSPVKAPALSPIATLTTLSSSVSALAVGQSVTYKAVLSSTAATGSVAFKDGAVVIAGCASRTLSAGSATCVVEGYTAVGSHSITATYGGDANYLASTSAIFSQAVKKAATTTTVSSSTSALVVGQPVTYTATVGNQAAGGSVAFKDGGVGITGCSARAVSAGSATCTVSKYPAAGSHAITATYGGDGAYLTSTSAMLTQLVGKASTSTTLASSANPSKVGQSVTYTATVSVESATGTVEFNDMGTTIQGCAGQAVSAGAASCTVSSYTSAGSHAITAIYSGDDGYLTSTATTLSEKVEVSPPAPFRFFSPTSFWNKTVPTSASVDPSSASLMAALNEEEAAEQLSKHGPAINTTSWSVPVYTVPAEQPTVSVALVNHVAAGLQAAWSVVPLPANAQPAAGSDKHLVVWQPSTNRMWEFWRLEKAEGWQASWGGAMEDVGASVGVYGPQAWSGATTSWGASATSLPIAGGLITLEDLEKKVINHALALAVPNARQGSYSAPAQRTDGGSLSFSSLPEGAHLRLDPTLKLASLHLSPLTLMMAEAAQRYGIFIRDKASNLAFYAQDPVSTGANPYTGPHGYFEGKSPSTLLASFPWSHLQLLKMEMYATS